MPISLARAALAGAASLGVFGVLQVVGWSQVKAQSPPAVTVASVPTLHVATRRVELPVTVLDKKTGQPVTSLTATDFRLTSDGADLPITYFGAPGHTRPLAVYLVIRNDPIDTTALRRLATELPDALKVLADDARVGVASYNGVNNSLWVHPTSDRPSVVAALQQIIKASEFSKSKPGKEKKTAAVEDQRDSGLLDHATAKVDKAAAKLAEKTGQPNADDAVEPASAVQVPQIPEPPDEVHSDSPAATAANPLASAQPENSTSASSTPATPATAAVSQDISNAQSLKKLLTTYNMGSADAIHLVEADWDQHGDAAYQPMLIVIDDELSFCYVWYALKLHNELLRQGITLDELQEPHGGFSRAMVGFTKVWAPTGIPLDPENAFIRYRYETYLAKASGGEVVSIRTAGYKAGFTQLFSHARDSYQLEFEPPESAHATAASAVSGSEQPGHAVAAEGAALSSAAASGAATKDAARQASADAKLHSLHIELIARPGLDPAKYRILARNHYSALNPIEATAKQAQTEIPKTTAPPTAISAVTAGTIRTAAAGGSTKTLQTPQ